MAVKTVAVDRIIMGVDPGTTVMGYAVIHQKGKDLHLLVKGVIHLNKYTDHNLKLQKIFERITQLITDYLPDEMAIEAPFFGKNVQSMLKLGRAQGVAIAAAINRQVPVTEYAPKKVKTAVTGNGNASKEQVAAMLPHLLNFTADPDALFDESDAIAVALCHCYQAKGKPAKANNWSAFVKENPSRLK